MTFASGEHEDTALCADPNIASTTATSSFGLSASSDGSAQKNSIGSSCSGVTTINTIATSQKGQGDYLEIVALQPGTGTSTTVAGTNRICGSLFNAISTATITHATACSYSVPFRVGVHMDDAETIAASGAAAAPNLDRPENAPVVAGSGQGYQGFYLNYWQNTC